MEGLDQNVCEAEPSRGGVDQQGTTWAGEVGGEGEDRGVGDDGPDDEDGVCEGSGWGAGGSEM